MTERGRISRDTDHGPGVVNVGGKQYTFSREGLWRSDVTPRVGMVVEVSFDQVGAPVTLYPIPDAQVAEEQGLKEFAAAPEMDGSPGGGVVRRYGADRLLAEAVLVLTFFLLPNVSLGPPAARQVLSGWDSTGLNPETLSTNEHSVRSLLALSCLFAPLAALGVKTGWSRFLYAAPVLFGIGNLSYILAVPDRSFSAGTDVVSRVGTEATRVLGQVNAPTIAAGGYVSLLCAVYLAAYSFRRTG